MPGIQRCFFSTLDYLQQTHPHILELRWTPPGQPTCLHSRKNATTPPNARTPAPAHTGHQGKRAHMAGAEPRTLVLITHRTQHLTHATAAQGPPPSPTALSSASDTTTSTTTTTSSTTTTTSSSSTPPPKAAGETSGTGHQTCPDREQPRRRQGPQPNEARARSPAETQDPREAATQSAGAPRPQPAAKPKPKPKPGPTTAARAQGRPLRHWAPAIPGPAAAAPNTALPHGPQRRRHHLHGGARRGRGATHFVPPPLRARTPGSRTTHDQTSTARGSTSRVPAPLPTLDVSSHTANAPLAPPL